MFKTSIPASCAFVVLALALAFPGLLTAQLVTEYPVPNTGAQPNSITAGPDGALWFTEPSPWANTTRIGRILPSGFIEEFPLSGAVYPNGITAGPDGALWFVENTGNKVGRITTAGVITEFPLPTSGSGPHRSPSVRMGGSGSRNHTATRSGA